MVSDEMFPIPQTTSYSSSKPGSGLISHSNYADFMGPLTPCTTGEGNGIPLQYSCLENPMDGGAWKAEVHGVTKSQTRLSNFPFTFHFHALEKEMAPHSSVLAWRVPGMGEPGGLPSMGWHKSRTRLKRLSSSSSMVRVGLVASRLSE